MPPMDAPIDYLIDHAKRLAVVTYRTQPNFEEWSLTIDQLLNDPNYDSSFGVLFDRRTILSPADTEYINRVPRRGGAGGRAGGGGVAGVWGGGWVSSGWGGMREELTIFDGSTRPSGGLEEGGRWLAAAR